MIAPHSKENWPIHQSGTISGPSNWKIDSFFSRKRSDPRVPLSTSRGPKKVILSRSFSNSCQGSSWETIASQNFSCCLKTSCFFQERIWEGQWEDTQSVTITESQPSNLRKCRSWRENSFRAGCSLKCRLDTVLSWAWWLNVLICIVFVFVFGLSSSPGSAEVGVSRAWWSSKVRAPLLINLLLLLLLFSTTPSKSLHFETFFPPNKMFTEKLKLKHQFIWRSFRIHFYFYTRLHI